MNAVMKALGCSGRLGTWKATTSAGRLAKMASFALLIFAAALACSCTTISATLPDGTALEYRYLLQNKSARFTDPNGRTFQFDTKSDPVIELARTVSGLAELLAKQAATAGAGAVAP